MSAFETLVGRYERKIFRLTQNITQNREDAEDAMQEAFLKAYEHLGNFEGNSRFYTWLVRIAVNQALMKLRKRRPNQISLDEEIQTGEDSMPREVEDWGPSPEQRYEQTEMSGILSRSSANSTRRSAWSSSCATLKNCLPKKQPRLWDFPFLR